jgi:hypothetical protein
MDDEPGKERFSLTLLFDHKNMSAEQMELLKTMKAEAEKLCRAKFGAGLGERCPESGVFLSNPFRQSEAKPKHYPPGMVFVKFSSKTAPNVVDGRKRAITEASGDFYAGCWAHVSYSVYTFDVKGNKGVAFGLNNVQKIRDDEPFGAARTTAEDDFDAVDEPATAGATEGVDEIPF